MKARLLPCLALAVIALVACARVQGFEGNVLGRLRCRCQSGCGANSRPWHAPYYHTQWGQPVALVVPPTAEMESNYQWGVCGTEVNRINPQFSRAYPGAVYGGGPLYPTPHWPSDTRQFGVYYVRGPW